MNTEESWGSLLRESQNLAQDAVAHYEQNIRDAYAAIKSARKVGALLGIGRDDVIKVLNPGPDVPVAARPSLPTAVYLRAPGRGGILFGRMAGVLEARGYFVTGSSDQAWHLSRAGATIVGVNLACQLDDDPVWIEVLRAVFEAKLDEPRHTPLADYLPTMEGLRLRREQPELAEWSVSSYHDPDVKWKTLRGGQYERRRVFDPEAVNNLGQRGASVIDVQYIARQVENLLGKLGA